MFQGFVEVRLCVNNNVEQDPEQECFDENDALTWVETGDKIFNVTEAMGPGKFSAQVKLPEVECEQCILQWTYRYQENLNKNTMYEIGVSFILW